MQETKYKVTSIEVHLNRKRVISSLKSNIITVYWQVHFHVLKNYYTNNYNTPTYNITAAHIQYCNTQ